MSFDLSKGNVFFQFVSPTQGDTANSLLPVHIKRSSFDSEADATAFYALWTSADVTKCRFCKNDQSTEIAFHVVYSDLTVGSEEIIVLFHWAGTLETTGTYGFYFMPALSGNTSYGVGDTYGQYAAYPNGEYVDLISSLSDGASSNVYTTDGLSAGDSTGLLGLSTAFSGGSGAEYIQFSSAFAWTGDWSISVLVQFNSDTGDLGIFDSSTSTSFPRVWSDFLTDATRLAWWTGNGSDQVYGTTAFTNGEWYHITLTHNGTDDFIKGYVNGSLEINTDQSSGNLSDSLPLFLGGGQKTKDQQMQLAYVRGDVVSADYIAYDSYVKLDNATWLGTGTYTAPTGTTTYTLTYDGNGNDGGTAPTDPSSPYDDGSIVTVLGNTGSLVRTGYIWNGWNTATDGSGTHYDTDDTFTISANTILYAEWAVATITGITYDNDLAILPSCTVTLFSFSGGTYTQVDSTTSDGTTGAFTFSVSAGVDYMIVAYLAGTPNVFDCSDSNLTYGDSVDLYLRSQANKTVPSTGGIYFYPPEYLGN